VSTNLPPDNPTEPPRPWQHAHHHSTPGRKPWPIRHKIWTTAILSAIGLVVILGIAGAIAGPPKATSPVSAQTPNESPSPQATRSPATSPTHAAAAKKAITTAENACYKRGFASGDIYVRMITPGLPPQAQELGGEWNWDHVLNKCETSVQMMISTAPLTGGNCTQVGYVIDNPGYDPNATPAAPLKSVVAQAGPACLPPGPPATATSCHPLSDEGTCYEPGAFCRDDDHSMNGVAGDGETITCEDNNGWRWEPA
jgi:hypothetical protein